MGYIGKQPTPVPLTASDLDDDIISLAKMAAGTDGNIISYDASGNPVAIATGNDGQVFTSAGAGQPPAFEAAPAGGLAEADQWRLTTNLASGTGSDKIITANWERNDTNFDKVGTGMSESSGIFTFPSTGIWKVETVMSWASAAPTGADSRISITVFYTPDNSSYSAAATSFNNTNAGPDNEKTGYACAILDIDNVSNDKVKFGLTDDIANPATVQGSSSINLTYATFQKLGAT